MPSPSSSSSSSLSLPPISVLLPKPAEGSNQSAYEDVTRIVSLPLPEEFRLPFKHDKWSASFNTYLHLTPEKCIEVAGELASLNLGIMCIGSMLPPFDNDLDIEQETPTDQVTLERLVTAKMIQASIGIGKGREDVTSNMSLRGYALRNFTSIPDLANAVSEMTFKVARLPTTEANVQGYAEHLTRAIEAASTASAAEADDLEVDEMLKERLKRNFLDKFSTMLLHEFSFGVLRSM